MIRHRNKNTVNTKSNTCPGKNGLQFSLETLNKFKCNIIILARIVVYTNSDYSLLETH